MAPKWFDHWTTWAGLAVVEVGGNARGFTGSKDLGWKIDRSGAWEAIGPAVACPEFHFGVTNFEVYF